jgi:class 3 adenylate cyclase
VRAILDEGDVFATGYRLFQGRPYSAHTYFLDFFGRPLGTLTLGLAIDDELARRLGDVVGTEVCFVVEGRCVAGTPAADDEMRDRLAAGADAAPAPGARRMEQGDTETGAPGTPVASVGDLVTTRWNGRRWALVTAPLPGGEGAGIIQVLGVPLDPVLAPFDRVRAVQRWAGLGALTLATLLGLLISRGLVRPVRTLVAATDRVRAGDYEFRVDVPSRDEMGQLADAFNEMLGDLALKERYRGVLDKVVSRDVAEEMLRGEIRLGGETREVTALFADVRGFTSLSEGLGSQQVITLLNEWFDRAAGVVEAEGGVVDKFLGDGVMAIFGAPMSQDDHPVRAVRAALGMRERVEVLNREREARSRPPVLVGIGVASGPVVAGNMGSQNRLNYTVLGEAVNLAARLCGEAGPGEILVSPATREAVENAGAHLEGEEEEARQVKGVSRPVKPWRVERLVEAEPRGVPSGSD